MLCYAMLCTWRYVMFVCPPQPQELALEGRRGAGWKVPQRLHEFRRHARLRCAACGSHGVGEGRTLHEFLNGKKGESP